MICPLHARLASTRARNRTAWRIRAGLHVAAGSGARRARTDAVPRDSGYYWYVTRTATQSREKSREVELATLITRTRKLVLVITEERSGVGESERDPLTTMLLRRRCHGRKRDKALTWSDQTPRWTGTGLPRWDSSAPAGRDLRTIVSLSLSIRLPKDPG